MLQGWDLAHPAASSILGEMGHQHPGPGLAMCRTVGAGLERGPLPSPCLQLSPLFFLIRGRRYLSRLPDGGQGEGSPRLLRGLCQQHPQGNGSRCRQGSACSPQLGAAMPAACARPLGGLLPVQSRSPPGPLRHHHGPSSPRLLPALSLPPHPPSLSLFSPTVRKRPQR